MKKDQVYAVVDIESTGGSIGRGERMIQFACVLVRNGAIIERFDTFVNPLKPVPKRIQNLTGIHPSDLSRAPLFDDLAEFIYDLLEETIFVAHNVAFDYAFLNEELERSGLSPLTIPAIDTVELAQILFPTAESYSLQELVDWLGYDLNQPHHALFDAEAAAFLLQRLSKRIEELPLVTLEKLVELSTFCVADTTLFFVHALEKMKNNPKDLQSGLRVVHGIAIKEPSIEQIANVYRETRSYPVSSEQKKDLFRGKVTTRLEQEAMMDHVYHYMKKLSPATELAVEAAPGLGKSLGYLFPASYLSSPEKPIVISTYTTVLQNQLLEETVPLLKQLVPFDFNVALIKGRYHYLSLFLFEQKLKNKQKSHVEVLFCMRILVWLTETITGDLDELGKGSYNGHDFWEEIRLQRAANLPKGEKWTAHDFFARAQKQAKEASIIITNHSFLVHDFNKEEKSIPPFQRLIIDEAHHWSEVVQQAATNKVSYTQVKELLRKLGNQHTEDTFLYKFTRFLPQKQVKKYQLNSLQANGQLLEEEWSEFVDSWLAELDIQESQSSFKWEDQDLLIGNQTLSQKKGIKQIKQLLNDLLFEGNRLLEELLKEVDKFPAAEQALLNQFSEWLEQADIIKKALVRTFMNQTHANISWATYYTKDPIQSLRFQSIHSEAEREFSQFLHELSHVFYTSSTLSINGNLQFFKDQLHYDEIAFVRLPTPYQYSEQTKVYVPNDLPQMTYHKKNLYAQQLSDAVELLTQDMEENVLLLFRSLDSLQLVYKELNERKSLQNYSILAQNISGSRSKLIKQFKKNKKTLLLGANTFWEGVDFPEEDLRIVIVARLPFDSPERPLTKWHHQQLQQVGENPFMKDLLPKAVLRMKQGFGRLIRSNKDKGVFIVLDDRFIYSSYGKIFQKELSQDVTVEVKSQETIRKELKQFLKD